MITFQSPIESILEHLELLDQAYPGSQWLQITSRSLITNWEHPAQLAKWLIRLEALGSTLQYWRHWIRIWRHLAPDAHCNHLPSSHSCLKISSIGSSRAIFFWSVKTRTLMHIAQGTTWQAGRGHFGLGDLAHKIKLKLDIGWDIILGMKTDVKSTLLDVMSNF